VVGLSLADPLRAAMFWGAMFSWPAMAYEALTMNLAPEALKAQMTQDTDTTFALLQSMIDDKDSPMSPEERVKLQETLNQAKELRAKILL
jgi:hypothetical protein